MGNRLHGPYGRRRELGDDATSGGMGMRGMGGMGGELGWMRDRSLTPARKHRWPSIRRRPRPRPARVTSLAGNRLPPSHRGIPAVWAQDWTPMRVGLATWPACHALHVRTRGPAPYPLVRYVYGGVYDTRLHFRISPIRPPSRATPPTSFPPCRVFLLFDRFWPCSEGVADDRILTSILKCLRRRFRARWGWSARVCAPPTESSADRR